MRERFLNTRRGWLELCRGHGPTQNPGVMAGAPLGSRMGRCGMAGVP